MNGTAIRVNQLLNPQTGKAVIVAFDHGGSGVPPGGGDVSGILAAVAESRAEGLLVGPGVARQAGRYFARPGAPRLIVSMDAPIFSSMCGEHGKIRDHARIATAEHLMMLGATAAKVLLPVGYEGTEIFTKGVELVRSCAMECQALGLPLMVEPALWGVKASEKDNALIEHSARMSVELGADILKIPAPTDTAVLERIVRNAGVPVMTLGGAPRDAEGFAADMQAWMSTGVAGVVVGRNVWSRPNPAGAVDALVGAVHENNPEAVAAGWAAAGEPAA
ncbi:class I fructose-bisphosphate aldolase [Martelella soudanensis]|uniref:class I fructose-bisphosphate aldolase n=1 Tax=unclassified Martelella TaxID=2629616 RepID=UPI0015DE6001|nr:MULTISPECIES: hypothetical protein [unclassified Martelella]